jgi:hypothetical protein
MMHTFRLLGDFFHAASIIIFLVIVGVKGNGAGISLKSQYLFLLTFFLRYLDMLTTFYNWYNTLMKLFFILTTVGIIAILRRVEPAKSTYSPSQDSVPHWNLLMAAAIAGMVIHLVGGGVVDIRGSSGQEFEVHFEHYRCVFVLVLVVLNLWSSKKHIMVPMLTYFTLVSVGFLFSGHFPCV